MKLHTINTGYFKLDGGAMFGVVPKSIWQKLNPPDDNNLCTWALRCLLIEEGDRRILIDTGIGNKQDDKFFGHYHLHGTDSLDASLQESGFTKDDITDVILTHLHFDHCGGAIERKGDALTTAFPKATYWCHEAHWKWAVEPNDREKASFLKENILPIRDSGQLRFVAAPSNNELIATIPFSESIRLRVVNGHTRAMMLPQVQYKGQTLVYMADLLPSTGHIPLPYVMAYDMFPLTTLQEKKSFLEEAATGNYILYFEHDATTECCNLEKTEKGIRVKDRFALDSLG